MSHLSLPTLIDPWAAEEGVSVCEGLGVRERERGRDRAGDE